jgi:hypothetical protein
MGEAAGEGAWGMLGSQCGAPMPLSLATLASLLPGIALWALALALPLSALLSPLERVLASGTLAPAAQQLLLVVAGVALALGAGLASDILLSWMLGPGWASSLGLMAVLAGLFWSLAARSDEPGA